MKKYLAFFAAIVVAVVSMTFVSCGDDDAETFDDSHEYVDLGLPSGTLWATCNIGANSPEDYGDYFAWGETAGYNSGRTYFGMRTYKYCNGSYNTMTKYCTHSSDGIVDKKTELDLSDDAAYVNWGPAWRMPSLEQFQELIINTTSEWIRQNGIYGRKFTSRTNGNSIFLPTAGYRYETSLYIVGNSGLYWSRTLYSSDSNGAYGLDFTVDYFFARSTDRWYGRSVRPVRSSR